MNKITVIIPTYCPGDYLFDCLKSLSEQIFQDFTCIVVLNGPEEPYRTQIRNWFNVLDLNNAELLYSKVKGVSAARNMALDCCNSEYVVFLDDDDLVNPEYLDSLYRSAGHDSIVEAAVCNFTDSTPHVLNIDYIAREFRKEKVIELAPCGCPSVFNSVWGKLLPRNLLAGCRFHESLALGEDSLFMYQLMASPVKSVRYVPEATYLRRVRFNSASRRKYSIATIITNRFFLAFAFSKVYFCNITKMNFLFYARRIIAIFTKGLLILLVAKNNS